MGLLLTLYVFCITTLCVLLLPGLVGLRINPVSFLSRGVVMDIEQAIEILSQASHGILTLNDNFKEACTMATVALSREITKPDYKWKKDVKKDEKTDGKDTILFVNGKNFRCECGCGMFRRVSKDQASHVYKCNACGLVYVGEK